MKIVWHIRYCNAFIQKGDEGYMDTVDEHFIGEKSDRNLIEEYNYLKEECKEEYERFMKFDTIGGLNENLRTIVAKSWEEKYREMRDLANTILNDIEDNRKK